MRPNKRPTGAVPRLWTEPEATCAIFASGPSLTPDQVNRCRGLHTIAVNNGYRIAPWAELHLFYDLRWLAWHRDDPVWRAFAGRIFTLENRTLPERDPRITALRDAGVPMGLSLDPGAIHHGRNAGYGAINLAVLAGARRILLLGYDMRVIGGRTHWHDPHPMPTHPRAFAAAMLPMFNELPAHLARAGVEVINCTPGSALEVFPMMALEEALEKVAA